MSSKDWDWFQAEHDGSLVFPTVSGVAIYRNPAGNIVIRQESTMGEEDAFIIVPYSYLPKIIKALQAELAVGEVGRERAESE